MIVADASAVVAALVSRTPVGDAARARMLTEPVAAPEILDLEVASVLRRHVHHGHISLPKADEALDVFIEMPVQRIPHAPLLRRVWELRDNVTPYDASYAAAAELFGVVLVTADAKLAAAPGIRCRVEVLPRN
ncbi:MAG TPA: type II toxin-antitoxin system VapC family toxin [Cryptosporangiaceae bacterium]|nr:type II toxin-antitoxin system VapC family toxin [Cryptosporangiaceae bacterium]